MIRLIDSVQLLVPDILKAFDSKLKPDKNTFGKPNMLQVTKLDLLNQNGFVSKTFVQLTRAKRREPKASWRMEDADVLFVDKGLTLAASCPLACRFFFVNKGLTEIQTNIFIKTSPWILWIYPPSQQSPGWHYIFRLDRIPWGGIVSLRILFCESIFENLDQNRTPHLVVYLTIADCLAHQGNTCYLNAILQCIVHTPLLYTHLGFLKFRWFLGCCWF